jgi:hypothetical protein
MKNGINPVFSGGEADEVALYTRALSAGEIGDHYRLAKILASEPLPSDPAPPAAEPPLAGTGPGGGVLGGNPLLPASPAPPRGTVLLRRGTLIARGAPGVRNDLVVGRRGGRWLVRDRLALLRPGRACRSLGPRRVSCPASRVRRIVLYGGAGNDRLTVIGRIPARLFGGAGRDRTIRRAR